MTSYQSPAYYDKTLKDLNKRYYSVLENIVKIFPRVKLHPEFKAYTKPFSKDMTDITKLQSDFFLFKNELDSDSNHLSSDIKMDNEKIALLEKENKKLSATLFSLQNSNNASYGMLQDTKLLYNQMLAANWLLFLVGTGAVYGYYSM